MFEAQSTFHLDVMNKNEVWLIHSRGKTLYEHMFDMVDTALISY